MPLSRVQKMIIFPTLTILEKSVATGYALYSKLTSGRWIALVFL